jgi:hypothetical protein
MWWRHGSHSDDGRVGAAGVLKPSDKLRSRHRDLGIERMMVFDTELWAIGHVHDVVIKKRETLPKHGVETVTVFSDLQPTIRQTAHLKLGPGQGMGEVDPLKGVLSVTPRHRKWEPLAPGTFRHPRK